MLFINKHRTVEKNSIVGELVDDKVFLSRLRHYIRISLGLYRKPFNLLKYVHSIEVKVFEWRFMNEKTKPESKFNKFVKCQLFLVVVVSFSSGRRVIIETFWMVFWHTRLKVRPWAHSLQQMLGNFFFFFNFNYYLFFMNHQPTKSTCQILS